MIERSILDAANRMREPYVVATVVAVHGSAYHRAGARMILTRDRWIAGSVSADAPRVVRYDPADADDDDDVRAAFGVGYEGAIDVMLERGGGRIDPLALAADLVAAQRTGAVATVIRSADPGVRVGARVALAEVAIADGVDGVLRDLIVADLETAVRTGTSSNRKYGSVDVFVEALVPPPRLFVFGAGHDVVPLLAIGRSLGWSTITCTPQHPRAPFVDADEQLIGGDPRAYIDAAATAIAVVMSHHDETDRQHLGMLLGSRAAYIGVLGPRARMARMLADLGRTADARVHAPIGLELGADTPQQVALAIAADVQATLARAPATSLRDRLGTIHDAA